MREALRVEARRVERRERVRRAILLEGEFFLFDRDVDLPPSAVVNETEAHCGLGFGNLFITPLTVLRVHVGPGNCGAPNIGTVAIELLL